MILRFLPLLPPLLLLAPGCGREEGPAAVWNLPPVRAIDWRNPPQGLFSEEWHTLDIDGVRAGYRHRMLIRKGNEVHTRIHVAARMGRKAGSMRTESTTTYRETVDGRPLGVSSATQAGRTLPATFEGSVRDGILSYVRTAGGDRMEGTVRIPPGSVMSWGLDRRVREAGLETGAGFEVPYYDPELKIDGVFHCSHQVLGPDTLDYHGRRVEAVQIQQLFYTGDTKFDTGDWAADAWASAGSPAIDAATASRYGLLQPSLSGVPTIEAWVREDFGELEVQGIMGTHTTYGMELADKEAALAGFLDPE